MKKGHAATEFFMYSSVFLIIVMGAYFTIFFVQSADVSNKESLYVKWFGERFASSANFVMGSQQGFNYTMKFERLLIQKPYSVQFKPASSGKNAFVFITWSGNNATYTFPIGAMPVKSGGCVLAVGSADGKYYEINTSVGSLNLYNDGENITLSQSGC